MGIFADFITSRPMTLPTERQARRELEALRDLGDADAPSAFVGRTGWAILKVLALTNLAAPPLKGDSLGFGAQNIDYQRALISPGTAAIIANQIAIDDSNLGLEQDVLLHLGLCHSEPGEICLNAFPIIVLDRFVSTWNTTNTSAGSSTSSQIKLPLVASGTYDFEVDWGDGTKDTITVWDQAETTHTYSASGAKTLSISGQIEGWQFNNSGDKLKILTVESALNLVLGNTGSYFHGCSNLTSMSIVDSSATLNFSSGWRDCSSLISFPLIDTSSGTNFANAWRDNSSLTSFPLLDTSSGTNCASAWLDCSGLTSFPLLDLSSNGDFSTTWANCTGLTTFPGIDMSSATLFLSTWSGCTGIVSFALMDISNGRNFSNACLGCSALTTLAVGQGLDLGLMTNGTNFFSGVTLTTPVYNQLLVEMESVNSNTVTFNGGSSQHSDGPPDGTAARAALVADHTWSITDGGAV